MVDDHPQDECMCGDWRSDHRDGIGPCRYNGHQPDMSHGFTACSHFRLAGRFGWRATPTPENSDGE